ncbi:MAG TPA: PKD domain-containing protein, partial [Segetibacter sp.]
MTISTANFAYKVSALLFILVFKNSILFAQLLANFTITNPAGCAPLSTSFTNTTTGASAAATYFWDLGNGNTSVLKSPGGTYRDEKTYTVILTVTDGGQTSTKSQQVIVYKKPTFDFSVDKTIGCFPLTVGFTSTATAGDGTITNYFWDFGDGVSSRVQTPQTSHTYSFVQKSPVSLTITNSFGCFNTVQKTDLVEVLTETKASFTAIKPVVCNVSDPVQFNNTSVGPANSTYVWDFGDGQTSTVKNPTVTYTQKGIYTVKLTINSPAGGCSDSYTRTSYINVANFTTDFDIPALVCANTAVTFTNKSTTGADNTAWSYDNNYSYNSTINFSTAGLHKVTLTNTYGTCQQTVTKDVTVKAGPKVNGFIINAGGLCGAPVTVGFKDTTSTAVSWLWNFNYPYSSATSIIKEPSYTFTSQSYYTVGLTVTNAEGCASTTTKSINTIKPNIAISILGSSGASYSGCTGLVLKFGASPATDINSYKWDFGDGSATSTDAQPSHTFANAGSYSIKLTYTTTTGCSETISYYNGIQVYSKPSVDFTSTSGTTICGNTPVKFTATLNNNATVSDWYWNFGDYNNYYNYYTGQTTTHQFLYDSSYTVSLIAVNGTCRDTVVKTKYITVLPPFPIITSATNTCSGTRGLVTFIHNSKKVISGTWDFGDGSTAPFNPALPGITHTYTATGTYKVVLTGVNNSCSVRDSITAYVLLKQTPVLSFTNTDICGNDRLNVTVNNLVSNPYILSNNNYYAGYNIRNFQYGDGTNYNGYNYGGNVYWTTSFTGYLQPLQNGQKDLRVITTSTYFNCNDTSAFVPLKIKGPVAGFSVSANNVCYKSPTIFTDTSKATNGVAIKKWDWTFGDGTTQSFTTSNSTVSHNYTNPGYFYSVLKVTDNENCTATTDLYNHTVTVNGPKADFSYYPASVSPNTTVYFSNTTNNYNSYSTQYVWTLPNGTTTTSGGPSYTFTTLGSYTVKLVAKNPVTGCSDTAIRVINVKNVNAAFTYTTSYVNNNTCPPVIVRFSNTSVNATPVSWSFGDGSKANNQSFPSHTYYNPGVYMVKLYVKDQNGAIDSTMDSIIIKGPYAKLQSDILTACSSAPITLTAQIRNATSFTWDFGDGSLLQTTDSFAVHNYLTPGVYSPALILKDGSGCSGTSDLQYKIVIDTLNIAIRKTPEFICNASTVQFNPSVYSLAADQLSKPLIYSWDFGTGIPADTADVKNPTFVFNNPGNYPVRLFVSSEYGCTKQVVDTIRVLQRAGGKITGPAEICQSGTAQFSGSTSFTGTVDWSWNFKNGNNSTLQNPAGQSYKDPGTYQVLLVVNNGGCRDTVTAPLIVHALPNINLVPATATICLGKSIQLTAADGVKYDWRTDAGLSSYTSAQPLATPKINTTYKVEATNTYG